MYKVCIFLFATFFLIVYKGNNNIDCIDKVIKINYNESFDRLSEIKQMNKTTIIKEGFIVKDSVEENNTNTVELEDILNQFHSLYNELIDFKSNDSFIEYGFGAGGKYIKWLNAVEQLKHDPDSELLLQKGITIEELRQLGIEYANSRGQETDYTVRINRIFFDVFNNDSSTSLEISDYLLPEEYYENIKAEFNFFGKWWIDHTITTNGYPYEIYYKNDEYIGIIPRGDYYKETLIKDGNKYFIKGNTSGEYYVISDNLNMTLYDNDGLLWMYKAKFIK